MVWEVLQSQEDPGSNPIMDTAYFLEQDFIPYPAGTIAINFCRQYRARPANTMNTFFLRLIKIK